MLHKLKDFKFLGLILIIIGSLVGIGAGWALVGVWHFPIWSSGIVYTLAIAAGVMAIICFFIKNPLLMKITGIIGILAGIPGALIPLIGGILLLIGLKREQ